MDREQEHDNSGNEDSGADEVEFQNTLEVGFLRNFGIMGKVKDEYYDRDRESANWEAGGVLAAFFEVEENSLT